jgi:hypothetical protein
VSFTDGGSRVKSEFRAALLCLVVCALASGACPALASEGEADEKQGGFVFFPIIFYSPETKLGVGASVMYYFRGSQDDSTNRPSTIQPLIIYTLENQIVSSLETDIYWDNEVNRLVAGIGYIKFPDLFYGIGPNTTDEMEEEYTPETFILNAGYYRTVKESIKLGLSYEFARGAVIEREEGGLLDEGDIPGSRGGDVSGLGFSAAWDTRDNLFYPTGGSYHHGSATFFDDAIGSDFAFNRYIVDLRKYLPVGRSTVFAIQGFGRFSSGTPPFQMMATLGGQDKGRGYYGGRFRDKHSLVAQAELRRLITRRWGVVLFGGAGAVAPDPEAFRLDEAKPFGGFGIRYVFSTDEKINVRLDFGFAKDSSGFYITAGEAF